MNTENEIYPKFVELTKTELTYNKEYGKNKQWFPGFLKTYYVFCTYAFEVKLDTTC
jgi:hypothetical protein